jgi:hypothetical protein
MGVCVFDISRGQRSDSSSAADGGDFFHRPSGQEHEHNLVFSTGFSSGFFEVMVGSHRTQLTGGKRWEPGPS